MANLSMMMPASGQIAFRRKSDEVPDSLVRLLDFGSECAPRSWIIRLRRAAMKNSSPEDGDVGQAQARHWRQAVDRPRFGRYTQARKKRGTSLERQV